MEHEATSGLFLAMLGVVVICQVLRGNAISRLGL